MTKWKMSMNKIVAALVFLAWGNAALALQAPDTPLVTGPNFQQAPAAQILVTPTGGAQTTLGQALASSGITVPSAPLLSGNGAALGPVTAIQNVPIGSTTPSTGAFTTGSTNAGFTDTSAVGIAATPPATVTSATTSETTGAAGVLLPIANPTGIVLGQIASGTNIPASDPVVYVSGGTAIVNLSTPVGVPNTAVYVAMSNTTSLVPGMFALDTTTAVFPTNTYVIGINGNAAAPVTGLTTGSIGASGQTVIPVSSGGTTCLPGSLLFDATTAVVPIGSLVSTNTATSITITNTLSGPTGASDAISCYPNIQLNQPVTGAVLASDALVFSPMITLANATTGSVPSGTTVSLSATTSNLTGNATVTGLVNMGVGGLQQSGIPFVRAYGNANNKFGEGYGTVTLVGLGAGAHLAPDDYLTTAVGYHALFASTQANTESTAIGWNAQKAITTGGFNTTVGINTLGSCLTCVHDMAFGTDSMRNTLTAAGNIGIGVSTLINDGSAGSNIAIGDNAFPGNINGGGQFNIAIGNGALGGTALTTATENILMGESAGSTSMTSASANVGIGHLVFSSLVSANNNVAIGFHASNNLQSGGSNTCIGSQACYGVTGSQNTVVGAVPNASLANLTTATAAIVIGYNATPVNATQNSSITIGSTYYSNAGTPLIGSGFGTGATVPTHAGNKAFTVNVGTGGTASTGVITLSVEPNGSACHATDNTNSASFIEDVVQNSATQVTITNYSRTTGTAIAWTASDILTVSCDGF